MRNSLISLFILYSISNSGQSTIKSFDSQVTHSISYTDLYYNSCSFAFMGHYEPLEIRTYKDLPKNISRKVKKNLKKRVGKKLAKNFHLTNGRIINLEELKKRNNRWGNSKTTYELCISYRNLEAGIKTYASAIKLDKEGTILKNIEFPFVSKNSKFKELISFNDIKGIAKRKKGVYIEKVIVKKGDYVKYKTEIEMKYNKGDNLLVWKFINKTQNVDHTMLYNTYIFNAHNGKFLKYESKKGTWIN